MFIGLMVGIGMFSQVHKTVKKMEKKKKKAKGKVSIW